MVNAGLYHPRLHFLGLFEILDLDFGEDLVRSLSFNVFGHF